MGGRPHRQGDLEASDSQRERLIDAFTKVAAENGYADTTVSEISATAGVPRSTFYDHFSDRRQCLTAAYDTFFERLMGEARHAVEPSGEWPFQVKLAVAAGLGFVSETATRARFFAVEAPTAGPMMIERYLATMTRIVPLLRAGRQHYPNATALPDITEQVLIGGIACLIGAALLDEDYERVAALEPELVEFLLTPYVGIDEAKRIAA